MLRDSRTGGMLMSNHNHHRLIDRSISDVSTLPYPQASATLLGVLEVPCGRMTCHKTYAAPGLVVISLWRAGPTAGEEEKGFLRGCFPAFVRGGFGIPKAETRVFRSSQRVNNLFLI